MGSVRLGSVSLPGYFCTGFVWFLKIGLWLTFDCTGFGSPMALVPFIIFAGAIPASSLLTVGLYMCTEFPWTFVVPGVLTSLTLCTCTFCPVTERTSSALGPVTIVI